MPGIQTRGGVEHVAVRGNTDAYVTGYIVAKGRKERSIYNQKSWNRDYIVR